MVKNNEINPWQDIVSPKVESNFTARRVNESIAWDIYWGIDSKENCLLIMHCCSSQTLPSRLPNFAGLRVETQEIGTGRRRVILRLLHQNQRDIFYRLCIDIIGAIEAAQTEEQMVQQFMNRTWRWHRLLKVTHDTGLTLSELRGLMGELTFFERHMLPHFDPYSAVYFWKGPFGDHKDFECGNLQIEVKTKRNTAVETIAISSETQLTASLPNILFLYVIEVLDGNPQTLETISVAQLIDNIRSRISELDLSAVEQFDNCLAAAGYEDGSVHSGFSWQIGNEYLYRVEGNFPRISPSMYPLGIEKVKYSISLASCSDYRVEIAHLAEKFFLEK